MIGECRILLIAAMDHRQGIGRDNQLLWHIPADLKRFKALTMGAPIVMGRKTAESLGRALPGRTNYVLTRSGQAPFDAMVPVASLEAVAAKHTALWVIGGGEVYALAMPLADELHLTLVDEEYDADTFFPPIDMADWKEAERSRIDGEPSYSFLTLTRNVC